MKLSPNFTLEELTATNYPRLQDEPSTEVVVNLCKLAITVLQPLRDHMKEPIRITSGYRSKELNRYVGGVANSYHLKGLAADIHVRNERHAALMFSYLKRLESVDSVLFERKGKTTWLHVQTSWNPRHIANWNFLG